MTFSWFERFLYTNVYFDDFLMGWGEMEAKITILMPFFRRAYGQGHILRRVYTCDVCLGLYNAHDIIWSQGMSLM